MKAVALFFLLNGQAQKLRVQLEEAERSLDDGSVFQYNTNFKVRQIVISHHKSTADDFFMQKAGFIDRNVTIANFRPFWNSVMKDG